MNNSITFKNNNKRNETPLTSLGLFTFLRTYSRRIVEDDPNSPLETYQMALKRIINGCNEQLHIGFTDEEQCEIFDLFYNLKCALAGRFLWQLGSKTVDKMGLMSLQNCSFRVINQPVEPFTWIMNFLMLGSGCGYRICPSDIEHFPVIKPVKITRIDTHDADFIVPDKREGWVKLFGKLLKSHFYSGEDFSYSCVLIRSMGAPIKSFGGISSGPDILCDGMAKINTLLNSRAGSKPECVDLLDVLNIVGMIVASGNVRRCLPEYSLISTDKGLVRIADINIGDKVLTSEGYHKVSNKFDQGFQDLVTIVTDIGTFNCTSNHRMAVNNKSDTNGISWKQASELTQSDKLLVSLNTIEGIVTVLPDWEMHYNQYNAAIFDENMAWFFGFYLMNRMIFNSLNTTFNIPNNRNPIYNKMIGQLRLFNSAYKSRYNEKYGISEIVIDKSLDDYLNQLSCQDNMQFVYQSKIDSRANFVVGLFDNYNYLSVELVEPKELFNIISCSVNYDGFINDVQSILLSIGILSFKFTENKMVTLIIRDKVSKYKWCKIINQYSTISYYYQNELINYYQDLIDGHVNIHNFSDITSVPVVEVMSCVKNKEVKTYDIEVDEVHHFFCNGYLTHNSAQICIGDSKDTKYLKAKRWDLGNIPNWRCHSNNSIICNDINEIIDNEDFWSGYKGNGEPYGLINLRLSRECGRLGETQYPDPFVDGYNPCGEQPLYDGETCCLSTIFLPNIADKTEFFKCIKYNYIILKNSLRLKCPQSKKTEEIVHQNMRMGISIGGYAQSTEEQKSWLSDGYKYLRELDVEYSKTHNLPTSIKLTTVKPDGCCRPDTLVSTSNGLMRLSELGNLNGPKWQNIENFDAYIGHDLHKILKFYVNGYSDTKIVTTADGLELECTLNHKLRVLVNNDMEWKQVGDLKPGDKLVTFIGSHPIKTACNSITVNVFDHNLDITDFLIFLAVIYSVKTKLLNNNQIQIDTTGITHYYFKWLKNYLVTVLNINLTIDGNVIIIDDQLNQIFNKFDCFECKKIPLLIRSANKSDVITFINTLFNVFVTDNNINSCVVKNYSFANEIIALGRNVGFNMSIYQTDNQFIVKHQLLDYSRIWNNHYWIDEVKNVVGSKSVTCDIEVDDVHEYMIGGVISHNTSSTYGNVTPGIHPGFSEFYIRRIRIGSNSPLVDLAIKHGHDVEYVKNFDGSNDYSTKVISFPCKLPKHTMFAKNCTAIDQLEIVKKIQTEWSDNSVSVSVYYRKNELDDIKKWLLENYNNSLKSVSFMLHSDHGFQQAPFEEISEETYNMMIKKCIPITDITNVCGLDDNDQESLCIGGYCPIR